MKLIPNEDTAAICGLFCGTCQSYPDQCKGCLSNEVTGDCQTKENTCPDCKELRYWYEKECHSCKRERK